MSEYYPNPDPAAPGGIRQPSDTVPETAREETAGRPDYVGADVSEYPGQSGTTLRAEASLTAAEADAALIELRETIPRLAAEAIATMQEISRLARLAAGKRDE